MSSNNLKKYLAHIEYETRHRKKWLPAPVMNKRYISGIIRNTIKEHIHSRMTEDTTVDPLIRARVLAKTDGHCYICWRKWNPKKAILFPQLYFALYQVDHIVPFSKMGANAISNYMPICSRCNVLKTNLTLAEARKIYVSKYRR